MQLCGWRTLFSSIGLGLFISATSFGKDTTKSIELAPPRALEEFEYGITAPAEMAVDLDSSICEKGLWTHPVLVDAPTTYQEGWLGVGCYSCCCPTWTARGGLVFLRRDNQDNRILTNGGTPISIGGLNFDYEAGPMFNVIRHGFLQSPWDLEVNYFGVHDFDSAASDPAATSIFSIPTILFGANTVTSTYNSELDNTEINFRRAWNDWLILLGGFRWVEIGDVLTTNVLNASHSINVNNHLYGAQIGAEAMVLSRNAFSVELFGKAGIYRNDADQSTTLTNVGGAFPLFSADDEDTAFIGELALTGSYVINDRWSARAGYQVMWIDRVALAPDQIDVSNITTGAATLDMSGHPIYHGFTLAAEYVW